MNTTTQDKSQGSSKPAGTPASAAPATVPQTPATAETKNVPAETKTDVAKAPDQTAGFVADMNDILSTSKSRASGGSKIRANVGYTLVAEKVKSLANTNVPEQEQVILKILNKALSPARPVISEPDMFKLVVAAYQQGVLKTKQEPFHIFRYYRTDLIKRGVLRQVDIDATQSAAA